MAGWRYLALVVPTPSPSLAPVHTTGVNWDSIGPLLIAIVGCAVAVATYVSSRTSKKQEEIKTEIADAVGHLSDVLVERLETKENVSSLKERIAKLESQVNQRGYRP